MAGPIPAELVCSADDLVTLPAVVARFSRITSDPAVDVETLGRLASWDPALTARLLAAANDRRWGQSGLIDSATRAIAVLDARAVRQVLTGLRAQESFDGIPAGLLSMESFWLSSVRVALAAREVAIRGGKGRPEVVFAAGLLLDVGRMVMLLRSRDARGPPPFDHARVGAALAATWKLPSCLRACITYRQQPGRARNFRDEVAIVHIANSLAALASRGSEDLRDAPAVSRESWQRAGLEPAQGLAAVALVQRQALDARRLFTG